LFYLYFFLNISSTVLNVEQFQRFMAVIKKLGDRVEKEHDQFLRDSQRLEDRSATAINGSSDGLTTRTGMDFETLVGGVGADSIKADTELNGNWEDDVWGSILSSNSEVRVPPQSRKKEKEMTDLCRPPTEPFDPSNNFCLFNVRTISTYNAEPSVFSAPWHIY
jgi:hypothetical protein